MLLTREHDFVAMAEWHRKGKTDVPGKNHVPVPLCPLQIWHGLTWDWDWSSVIIERRLTARARAWPPRSADFVFNSYLAVNTPFSLQRAAGFYWLAKLRIATISFVMSARLFTRNNWLPLNYFREILCLSVFRKYVEKGQVSLKSDENKGYLTLRHF
jgi:hypothetical protein